MADGFKIADSYVEIDAKIDKSGIEASATSAGDSAGRSLARSTTRSFSKAAEGEKKNTGNILRKMFTPSPDMFAALRAPFAAALSTPVSAAVIAVAGIAAAAFIGAFAAALATAGLGAVFLGIGAAALLGARKDREQAEKDLEKAEERVRKAEQRAKSGSAASKQNLADATKALAQAQEVVNNGKAFEALDTSLGKLGKTLQEVGARAASPLIKPLTAAFDALTVTVTKLEPMLKTIFTDLAPVIPALTAGISGFVTEFLKVITADPATLQGMRDTLIAIGANLPRVGAALGEMFAQFASNENNVRNIGILFNIVVFAIQYLTTAITFLSMQLDHFVAAWHIVQDAISAFVSWLTGTAGPAIGKFFTVTIPSWINSAVGFFKSLPGKISAAIAAIPGLLKALFVRAFDFVTTAIGFGIGTAVRLMLTLPGKIVSAIASIPSRISSIFNSAKSLMSSIASSAVSAAVSIFSGLPGKAASAISSIRSRISGVFSGAGSWLVSAGKSIIQGVANGIVSAIGGAVAAARRAAQNIVNGFKSALSIGSPSRVMAEEVGKWIPAGIGEGIKHHVELATPPLPNLPGAAARSIAPATGTTPSTVGGMTVNIYPVLDMSKITSPGTARAAFDELIEAARRAGVRPLRTSGLAVRA